MKGALITGGGKRIGRAIATALAGDGWFVHIHYNQSEAEAEEALSAVTGAGGEGRVVRADLEDAASVEGLVADCAAAGPPLGLLVNNAALFEYDTAGTVTAGSWERHQRINLKAPLLLARDFAALIPEGGPEGGEGCIVNLIDNKVFALNPDFLSYTVTKVGLRGLTEALAMAYAPRIRVCGIAPGVTLISGAQTPESFAHAHGMNPLERGCSLDQIVGALRFILATPSLTGQIITIDGGQSLQRLPRDVAFLGKDDKE